MVVGYWSSVGKQIIAKRRALAGCKSSSPASHWPSGSYFLRRLVNPSFIVHREQATLNRTCDVVAETPAAKGKPVLTLAGRDAFQLLDVVTPHSVIGIFGEDGFRALFGRLEITVALYQLAREPFVMRS
jgi:hypothetical protein